MTSVAGLFGRAAAGYDDVGFFHQVARRLLVLAGVGPGIRVLDVAWPEQEEWRRDR